MKITRKLLLIPIGLLLIGAVAIKLHAQQGNPGISVSPSNFELTVNPDSHVTRTISVTNNTNLSMTVKPVVKNFTAQGEEGGVDFTENATTYALSNWVSTFPNQATIDPQRTAQFTFTIKAPANAEPGGHFGSILFTTVTNAPSRTGAAVSQEVASLLLVRVPGDVHEQMNTLNFGTDQQFYEFGPVQFTTTIQNTGGVHEHPIGQILIKNMFGQETAVDFAGRNVLPNATRIMPTVWNNHLLFGKYTAELILTYGNKGQQLYASTVFYAFPIRYGLIVLAIIIVLFMMRKRLKKAFKALATGK